MRALVLSDSHGIVNLVEEVLSQYKSDAVIFLGDNLSDMSPYIGSFAEQNKSYHAVAGNCDYSVDAPDEKVFDFDGRKVFICHGHQYNVKMSYDRIIYKAMEEEAYVCLFGHTHFPVCFYQNGILFLNPGSISSPRGIKFPGFGIVEVENGKISGYLYIKKDGAYELLEKWA